MSAKPPGEDANRNSAQNPLKLNEETIKRVLGAPLPGINDVELVFIQPASPLWVRWTEQLTLNITASLLAAGIIFGVGVYVGDGMTKASTQPLTCLPMK
jgi:hypothetical protein